MFSIVRPVRFVISCSDNTFDKFRILRDIAKSFRATFWELAFNGFGSLSKENLLCVIENSGLEMKVSQTFHRRGNEIGILGTCRKQWQLDHQVSS